MAVTGDGAAPATTAFSGAMGTTELAIGMRGDNALQIFGTIRNVRIYPTALSAPYLQNLTTDAAGFLGDPMWRYAANDDYYRKVANK